MSSAQIIGITSSSSSSSSSTTSSAVTQQHASSAPTKDRPRSYSDGCEEEELDPRVKVELETLNQSGTEVNRLEKEIDEARAKYQATFSECSHQLEQRKRKCEASIRRARPYYELKEAAKQAQSEALLSARKFQSANGIYLAAKETISLAELRLMDDKAASLSSAWQEMLNHALLRVTEAEREKTISEREHLKRAAVYADLEKKLHILEKKNKRSIAKARSYFETKKELEIKLQQVKQSVEDLHQALVEAKRRYAGALRKLEQISDSIHEKRRQSILLMYPREPGVGAEENADKFLSEKNFPTQLSNSDSSSYGNLFEDNIDSDTYCDITDGDGNDDFDDIDNESVFRAKVLTVSLDEEDTSFMQQKHGRRKKTLKRTQSLPLYPRYRSDSLTNECSLDETETPEASSVEEVYVKDLVPLADRSEGCPPDGDSLGSEKDSVSVTEKDSVSETEPATPTACSD